VHRAPPPTGEVRDVVVDIEGPLEFSAHSWHFGVLGAADDQREQQMRVGLVRAAP
jgi:hypothetical protein